MKKIITLCLILLSPIALSANQDLILIEGEDYRLIAPSVSNNIKTQIFFWYGCESCFKLMPLLEKMHPSWIKTPVSIYKSWRQQTKIFYTFRQLNLPFTIDQKLMSEIHKNNLSANDLYSQKKFILSLGVKSDEFDKHFYSQTVNIQASETDKLKQQMNLIKVPSALIAGKYYIDLSMSNNLQNFTKNISLLEELAKTESFVLKHKDVQ